MPDPYKFFAIVLIIGLLMITGVLAIWLAYNGGWV